MCRQYQIDTANFWCLKQGLNDDTNQTITKDDLRNLATKDDLRNLATKDDLRSLATRADLLELFDKLDQKLEAMRLEFERRFERIERHVGLPPWTGAGSCHA
jgi:3-methyladenine DNA glycosylase AlkD